MSKSRARFLSELLGTTGLVKKSKSALAGADEIIDLSTLPSIPNSKLTNSSITINSNATSLGGSVTLTTANVAENTNLYYTDARADARIAAASTSDLSEGTNLYYTDARADARVARHRAALQEGQGGLRAARAQQAGRRPAACTAAEQARPLRAAPSASSSRARRSRSPAWASSAGWCPRRSSTRPKSRSSGPIA